MDQFSESPDQHNELETLESSDTVVESTPQASPATPDQVQSAPGESPVSAFSNGNTSSPTPKGPKPPRFMRLRNIFRKLNIYLLLFILIVIVAGIVVVLAILHSKNSSSSINTQTLSQSTLSQLANSDVTVGDSKQVLNVQSNAVFSGTVLVRSNLQVAGAIQVGGSLSLSGITVSGTSAFDQVQVSKNLSVAGDTALQGALTVQKSLNVNGSGTFSGSLSAGQITAGALQLNGDLTLTHHITFGGAIPSKSNGSALGAGGTASVSGSDSAGSISINTGSGAAAGCFITVNFTQKFNATPHVLITPVGSAAGGLGYYVNRSTSNFSVCTATTPPDGQTFGFDYLVLD